MSQSEAQRLKEEQEIRERDEKRKREKEEIQRRLEAQAAEEKRKRDEEEQRRVEEEKRRKKAEEEWKRLGPDVIQDLPPVPAPVKSNNDPGAVEAWYLDEETSKPVLSTLSLKIGREPGSEPVSMKDLREIGVIIFHINLNDFSIVKQILKERCYKHTDEVRISQTSKDDLTLERWFQEHFTDDEQLRLVTDGSCYFDVRSKQDRWIRVQVKSGHLIIISPGLYHRATLDEDDFVALFRGFQEAPRFIPIYRVDSKSDATKVRLDYLMKLKKGDVSTELGFL